jgi:2-oxoisovalerate dehydrogenase E1 component alpha subunit
MQKRHGGDAVTIVVGGDASTHEGDFASCLVWSTRPGNEVPVLIIVMNNGWGISTSCGSQHAEKQIIDRGKAFGIPGELVDGNDVVASWHCVRRGLEFCRRVRRPYLIEAKVSRLYGHSSSSGCQRARGEPECIRLLERRLRSAGIMDNGAIERVHREAEKEVEAAYEQALREARPTVADVERLTFANSPVDAVYPGDYTGLPQ